MLTKDDLKEISRLLKPLIKDINSTKTDLSKEIQAVNAHNSRIEMKLIDMEQKFEKNLKQWKSELFDKIDRILGRVKTAEEENVILRSREDTREEIKKDFEKRISKLEAAVFPTP